MWADWLLQTTLQLQDWRPEGPVSERQEYSNGRTSGRHSVKMQVVNKSGIHLIGPHCNTTTYSI